MIVIGIIGSKGAGKDTVASYLEYKYGVGHHAHSDVYREVLSILRIPKTRNNLISLVELRNIFGEDVLVNALNKRLKEDQRPVQVVTGIRFHNELKNIKSFPKSFVVHIDASPEKRYRHQLKRNQNADDKKMSFEEFLVIEEKETEKHIEELAQFADFKIINDGTKEDLYKKIEEILHPIIEQK